MDKKAVVHVVLKDYFYIAVGSSDFLPFTLPFLEKAIL